MSLHEYKRGDRKIYADDLNRMAKVTTLIENLAISGATFSKGESGLNIHVPDAPEFFIAKATQANGSYPSFDNTRRMFPVLKYIGPFFDTAAPTADFDFNAESSPEVQVYNLAHCWIFQYSFIPVFKVNGQHWTWNNQKRTGQASAAITKGNLGNVVVQSLTIQARAKFADTANGAKVSVYHDSVEWVIDAEECP